MEETISRLTIYQIFKTILERPQKEKIELDSLLSILKQIKNHMPQTLSKQLDRLEKTLLEKKTVTQKEYDITIGGLPGACTLGLNISDPNVLIQLSEIYRSLGIQIEDSYPLDFLPAQIEILHYIIHNRMKFSQSKEIKVLLEKGVLLSLKKIVSCLEKKGYSHSFYYKVLKIMQDYFLEEYKLLSY